MVETAPSRPLGEGWGEGTSACGEPCRVGKTKWFPPILNNIIKLAVGTAPLITGRYPTLKSELFPPYYINLPRRVEK